MLMLHPEYRPPTDYKAPESKLQEKIEIPQQQFPQINFVGLMIGPRGIRFGVLVGSFWGEFCKFAKFAISFFHK